MLSLADLILLSHENLSSFKYFDQHERRVHTISIIATSSFLQVASLVQLAPGCKSITTLGLCMICSLVSPCSCFPMLHSVVDPHFHSGAAAP